MPLGIVDIMIDRIMLLKGEKACLTKDGDWEVQ